MAIYITRTYIVASIHVYRILIELRRSDDLIASVSHSVRVASHPLCYYRRMRDVRPNTRSRISRRLLSLLSITIAVCVWFVYI